MEHISDQRNTKEIRMIVKHTILEQEPLYDLREILSGLGKLTEQYTSFLQVKQDEIDLLWS